MKGKQATIQDIRAFNRFYTGLIGLLNDSLLDSDYSLAEVRVLYEIHAHGHISASQIMSLIYMDKGYLSRVLKQFEKDGLIAKKLSKEDARVTMVSLTAKGGKLFAALNEASNQQINTLITPLAPGQQQELVHHMNAIMHLLKDSLPG